MLINLLPFVNKYLVEKAQNNPRDFSYFHASEWDRCHRKIVYEYYEAMGYIQIDGSSLKADPQLERIFDNGTYTHYRWAKYLTATGALMGIWKCVGCSKVVGEAEKLGVLKPKECNCGSTSFDYHEVGFRDEETMWGGHVDAIVDVSVLDPDSLGVEKYLAVSMKSFPPEKWGNRIVIDFKTMNPFKFRKLEEPLPEHKTQMQIYLYLSGLKYGKFIYEDKAFQGVKEFLVTRDDRMLAVKKQEALHLKHIVTHTNSQGKRVLPPRAYEYRTHEDCKRCKFRGNCWSQTGGTNA